MRSVRRAHEWAQAIVVRMAHATNHTTIKWREAELRQ